ncbi:phage capsid protein, partial [Corallococcus exiguus]
MNASPRGLMMWMLLTASLGACAPEEAVEDFLPVARVEAELPAGGWRVLMPGGG